MQAIKISSLIKEERLGAREPIVETPLFNSYS